MKKLKILTIIAAAAVVSAGMYAAPVVTGGAIQGSEVAAFADGNFSVTATTNSTNSLNPTFKVTNTSSSTVNLSDLKLYYYFTDSAAPSDQNFVCYYAGTTSGNYQALTSSVQGSVQATTKNNSNCVLVVTFSSGTLDAGQSMEVQTNVNKVNWTPYENLSSAYGAAYEYQGTSGGGSGTGGGTVVKDSTISTTYASYDKTYPSTISTTMNLNGNTLSSLVSSQKGNLVQNVDYTVNGNTVTFTNTYLNKLAVNSSDTVTFNFSAGNSQKMTINVKETQIAQGLTVDLGSVNAKAGETVKIPVKLSGLKDKGLRAFNFNLKYDTNVLEVEDIEAGDIDDDCLTAYEEDGVIKVLYAAETDGTGNINADSTLLYITVKVKDTAKEGSTSNITLANAGKDMFLDKNSEKYTVTYKNGTVSVDEADKKYLTVDLGNVSGKAGDTVRIPVKVSGVTADQLRAFNFNLKYDTNVLEDVDVEAGDINDDCLTAYEEDGIIKVLYAAETDGTGNITTDGVIVYVTAKIKDTAKPGTSDLTVANSGMFLDKNSGKYTQSYANGKITVEDKDIVKLDVDLGNVSGKAGDTVRIPVKVSGVTADQLRAFNFNLSYDTNVLEDVDVEAGDINDDCLTAYEEDGVIKVLYAAETDGTGNITTDGVIVYVTAKIKDTAKAGQSNLTVANSGMFLDKNSSKYTQSYSNGIITVEEKDVKKIAVDLGAVSGKAGDTVKIPVKVSGVNVADQLRAFNFNLSYDTNVLEDVDVEAGDIINDDCLTAYEEDGVIKVLYAAEADGTGNISTDGVVVYVTAKIKDTANEGISKLTVANAGKDMFLDKNSEKYSQSYSNGTVTVEKTVIDDVVTETINVDLGTVSAKAGDTVKIPVKVSGLKDNALRAFNFNLNYDADVLEDVDVEAGVASDDYLTAYEEDGQIKVLYSADPSGDGNITADGDLVYITATVKADAEGKVGKITLANAGKDMFLNKNSEKYDVNYVEGKVTVEKEVIEVVTEELTVNLGNLSAKAGEEVRIPVTVSGIKDKELRAFNFNLSYDTDLLEDVDVEAGVANDDYLTAYEDEGQIKVLYSADPSGDGNITADGALIYITGTVKADAAGKSGKIVLANAGKDMFLDKAGDKYEVEYVEGSMAIEKSGGTESGGTESGGTESGGTESGGTESGGTGSGGTESGGTGSEGVTVKDTVDAAQYIEIGRVTASAGSEVVVPVTVCGDLSTSNPFTALDFKILYDTNVLEAVSVSAGELVKKPTKDFSSKLADGSVYVSFFENTQAKKANWINKSGVIANITFKVKDSAKGTIVLNLDDNNVQLSDPDCNAVKGDYKSGTITIA